MLAHLLAKMRARGTPLSMLYPFRHDFYRSLGWGLTSAMHRYRLRPSSLPEHRERGRVRPLEPGDVGAVRRCYERFAAQGTGLVSRAEPVWQSMLSPELVRVAVVPSREIARTIDGYLIYRMIPEGGSQAIELEVVELVSLHDDARLALLGFLSAQRDHVSRIQLAVPADEPLFAVLSDPRGPSTELVRGLLMISAELVVGAMTRIVHLGAALRARGWEGPDGEVAIQMDDPLVADNAQPVTMRIRGHAAEVEPGRRDGVPLLAADAAVIAQIYMGHLRPSQAVAARLARVDPPSAVPALDGLLATRPALTLDVF
jgi:predicted acetyltransferase